LLALTQALAPGSFALEMSLPVMAWGVVLNLAGLFLLCRWTFRLPRWAGTAATLLAAVTFNPLSFSASTGFLPQVYGTASLAVLVALLSRLLAPCRQRLGPAVLLALTGAGLLSSYSELAPVAALLGCGFLGYGGWRAWRAGRPWAFGRFVLLAA